MRSRKCRLVLTMLVTAFVALFFATTVAQALLVKMSPQKMTRIAQRVVVADVWSVHPRHVKPAQGGGWGTIVTVVRLRVADRLKGASPDWLTLRVPGGSADGRTRVVEDAPAFYPGERVLLFLDDHGVVGWREGALEIVDGTVEAWGQSLGAAERQIAGAPASQAGGAAEHSQPREPAAAGQPRLVVAGEGALTPLGPDSAPPVEAPTMLGASQTILNDGFESGMGNWSLSGTTTWGQTSYRRQAGAYSAYGTQGAGAAPAAYPANADARMVYGPFSLSDATAATIDFDLWQMAADAGDKVQVFYSTDNATYSGYGYGNTSSAWAHGTQDLSNVPNPAGGFRSLLGQAQVWVMVRFISSASGQSEGGYVDNIVIAKTYTAASDPTISGISPGSASAGTGTNVTISGTNFGATQGAGGVTFSYRGTDRIPAPIVSWSGTQIVCTVPTGTVKGYPAAAGSGPVVVTNNAGAVSSGYPFTVTFAYGGAKWSSPNVTYRLNANCADTTAEAALIDAAWPTWNPASLFTLDRSGSNTQTALPASNDAYRDIFWATGSLGTGVLAVNQYWWNNGAPDVLIDSDIAFNDADFVWGDGSGGTYDIQTVATHELGHSVNLRDLYGTGDTGDIMYGMTASGTQKRALSADDTAGVIWVYGARPPMSGAMKVNSDAAWTSSVSVTLSSGIANATQMRFNNDGGTWSGWQAYGASAGWSIAATQGTRTVNAQYKDAGGNLYSSSDTIGYDSVPPYTDDDSDLQPHRVVVVALTPHDTLSGVAATQYRIDGGAWLNGTTVTLVRGIRHKRPGFSAGSHLIEYYSTDNAGNPEPIQSCTVTLGS